MDTSFWDDDEERLQIVYEDDQLLPPARTSTNNPGLAATAGQCAVLRDTRDKLLEMYFSLPSLCRAKVRPSRKVRRS